MLSLECRKVQALMSLYIDDALSYNLKMFVYNHLQKCQICKKKYLDLKKTIQLLKSNFNKTAKIIPDSPLFDVIKYEHFKENISAYLDGELDNSDKNDFNEYLSINNFARKYFNGSVLVNSKVTNFIKNNSPVLKVDYSKSVVVDFKKSVSKNLFSIQDFFFTLFFVFCTFSLILICENYFLPNNIQNYEKLNFAKIKNNILNIDFRKFLNN